MRNAGKEQCVCNGNRCANVGISSAGGCDCDARGNNRCSIQVNNKIKEPSKYLGLLMYASYFVLFLQLFLSHYVYKKKPMPTRNDVEVRRRRTRPSPLPPSAPRPLSLR